MYKTVQIYIYMLKILLVFNKWNTICTIIDHAFEHFLTMTYHHCYFSETIFP